MKPGEQPLRGRWNAAVGAGRIDPRRLIVLRQVKLASSYKRIVPVFLALVWVVLTAVFYGQDDKIGTFFTLDRFDT